MSAEKTLMNTTSFKYEMVQQLYDDLVAEFDPYMKYESNRSQMNEFGFIAWFIRNYTYVPMSLIEDVMSIRPSGSAGAATAAVIRNYENSCMEKPCSLDAGNYDQLQLALSLLKGYYAPKNVPLDRQSEEMESCLLYMAHLSSGYSDRGRKGGGAQTSFTTTPKEPLLVTVLDMKIQMQNGASIEEARNIFESHQLDY